MTAAIVAEPRCNPVAPPLGASELTGFLALAPQLLFRDVSEKLHVYRIQNPAKGIQ